MFHYTVEQAGGRLGRVASRAPLETRKDIMSSLKRLLVALPIAALLSVGACSDDSTPSPDPDTGAQGRQERAIRWHAR
jgi:hypothetical protein